MPLREDYSVIETDGSEEGWGAVLKAKTPEGDRICGYASGVFKAKGVKTLKPPPGYKSTDAEILAIVYALNAFKIHLSGTLHKKLTVRTDCHAIVSFFSKLTNEKKISRRRWISFLDVISGKGLEIKFEHIDGKENFLADFLSRISENCVQHTDSISPQERNTVLEKLTY